MCDTEKLLFYLVAVGLGKNSGCCSMDLRKVDWSAVLLAAEQQGVSAICMDGLQQLTESFGTEPEAIIVEKHMKLKWIASVVRQERIYSSQYVAARSLGNLYNANGIDAYVMKGLSLSRLYPVPEHRPCTDLDCFLMDAYEKGNRIAEENGLTVDRSYYKHSKIFLKGLTVENHQFLLPVKGSGKAKSFERELRKCIADGHNEYIGDTCFKATAPFFDSIFVLAHAQEHFLGECISLRHVCDWAMVLNAYADVVDWNKWKVVCRQYGLLSFGYTMSRLAYMVCGVNIPFGYPKDDDTDRRLLNDILYPKTRKDKTTCRFMTRVHLVRNIFRNSWKYRMFSDTNFLMFCGRRVWGYLFDKDLD